MINPQWLELIMSRTNFYGPKDVRAIEVRLYLYIGYCNGAAVPCHRLFFIYNSVVTEWILNYV